MQFDQQKKKETFYSILHFWRCRPLWYSRRRVILGGERKREQSVILLQIIIQYNEHIQKLLFLSSQ